MSQPPRRIVIIRRAALGTPDGINIFIFSLAEALLSKGHEVFIVGTTLLDPERIRELYGTSRDLEVMALARNDSFNHSYMRVAARWFFAGKPMVDRLRPDLTIVNGPLPMSFAGNNCVVAHDLERRFERLGPVRTTYKAVTYRRSHHIVATCTEIKWALVGQLGLESRRISVIPTCIDLTAYRGRPPSEREEAILHIGTVDYKNPSATIEAFGLLGSATARLYITGTMNTDVQRALDRLDPKIRANVEVLGFISADRLRALLGTVKVVSVPSRYFVPVSSPTVIEAFASSTPVVSFEDISRDLLRDGRSGFVSEDPSEMAGAFHRLMSDAALWERLSAGALATSADYSATKVADAFLGLT